MVHKSREFYRFSYFYTSKVLCGPTTLKSVLLPKYQEPQLSKYFSVPYTYKLSIIKFLLISQKKHGFQIVLMRIWSTLKSVLLPKYQEPQLSKYFSVPNTYELSIIEFLLISQKKPVFKIVLMRVWSILVFINKTQTVDLFWQSLGLT